MTTLSIELRGRPVRNLFQEAPAGAGSALILPGAYYSSQAPGLYFLRESLLRAGFDVLAIDYHYFLSGQSFSEASRAEAEEEAEAAYLHLAERARQLERTRGGRLLIAGKSFGSIVALKLALAHRTGSPTALVLLTPIEARLAAMLANAREGAARSWDLFAVRCGADEARDDAAWAQVVPAFARVAEVILERTTHGMDSLDGPRASLQGLVDMCAGLERWLSGD